MKAPKILKGRDKMPFRVKCKSKHYRIIGKYFVNVILSKYLL
jgi:hypothetical protein